MHILQMMAHFYGGNLAGAEKHFTAGLKFFDHPSFRRVPGVAVAAFSYESWNAWVLGRTDVARERMARMMAAENIDNPYEAAFSGHFAEQLLVGCENTSKPRRWQRGRSSFRRSINL
jgi:hypothetical protein